MRQLLKIKNISFFLLSISLLTGCDQFSFFSINKENNTQSKTDSKKRAKSLPIVVLSTVKNRKLSYSSIITGTLKAKRSVKVYNQIKGLLIDLPFYEGDKVKKGLVIARLDKTLIQLELNQAIVKEKQASVNLSRIKKLVPRNLVSEDEVSQSKTIYAIATHETKKQATALSYTKIKAPFDGIISQRLNEPGDVLSEHTHILSMIDIEKLIVKFPLSELLFPDINIGDSINIQIDALGSQIIKAIIIRKHPIIDKVSRQGIVEAMLQSPPSKAMPGQLCKIHFTSQIKDYLSISLPSIRHDQHSAYVFTYNKQSKTVAKQKIKIGQTINNFVEVTQGLEDGDIIVAKGLYGLRSGNKVQIKSKI